MFFAKMVNAGKIEIRHGFANRKSEKSVRELDQTNGVSRTHLKMLKELRR